MSDKETPYTPAPPGDFVLPFDLPHAGLRGRLMRLDKASAQALSAHRLPEPAARIAGEAWRSRDSWHARSSSMAASPCKPKAMARSISSPSIIMAPKKRAPQRCAPLRASIATVSTGLKPKLSPIARGDGALAITIEPRRGGNTYQGIVELSPDGIAASAETYFAQSEQLPTMIRLAAAPVFTPGNAEPEWRAGGIMLQATPERVRDEDEWERLALFLKTVEDVELVDTTLSARSTAVASFPRRRSARAARRAGRLSLRLRYRSHRLGAEILCAAGSRPIGRPGWHHPRALRVLRQGPRSGAGSALDLRLRIKKSVNSCQRSTISLRRPRRATTSSRMPSGSARKSA